MAIKTYFKMILMPALLAMMLALEADATALERGSSQSLRAKAHHIMAAVTTPTDAQLAAARASIQTGPMAELIAQKAEADAAIEDERRRQEMVRQQEEQQKQEEEQQKLEEEEQQKKKADHGRRCEACKKRCYGKGGNATVKKRCARSCRSMGQKCG